MINNQLFAFIKLQLHSGVSEEDIRKALATGRWSAEDVDESFAAAMKSQSTPPPVPSASPAKPSIVPVLAPAPVKHSSQVQQRRPSYKWPILVGVLIVMGGGFYILYSTAGSSTPAAQAQARDARRVDDLNGLEADLQHHYLADGSYPLLLSQLTPNPEGEMVFIPTDPQGGAQYKYQSTGSTYLLCASIEESKPPATSNPNATFSNGLYCITPNTQAGTTAG